MSSSKHHHTSDSKGERYARSFLAFALALSISLLSLFCCIKFYFITPKTVAGIFANEQYVTAFREDVVEYSHDLCKASMLPEDSLDSTISYSRVYDIVNSYISGALATSQEFTKTTYEDSVDELKKDCEKQINVVIEKNALTVDGKQKDGAQELSSLISEYLLNRLEISHIEALETVVNVGNIAGIIGIAATAVLTLVLVLIIISIGSRRYRAMRSVIHGINAAAMINLSLIAGLEIVKHIKSLVLYPTYVSDAFMSYVNNCEKMVGISSIALFGTALLLTATVWKLNRDSKK